MFSCSVSAWHVIDISDEIAAKFGLTPEQFGENLRDNYQRNDVEQFPIEPLEFAKDFICR
jgi:hypothetical protein